MTVHLMKVAVGIESVEGLRKRQAATARGGAASHVTRMWPKREAELLAGGSLYWSVRKRFACRQRIIGFEAAMADGVSKCRVLLDPELVLVHGATRRPFQGWRYLESGKAPSDLAPGLAGSDAELHVTLAALGLL